jgi:small subunit ribosomal protein S17
MKVFTGIVISKKMDKTATVAVERFVAHPVYKKRIKIVKKYQVHDELGSKAGEKVSFVSSKPVSKLKKWKIVKIINKKINNKEPKKEAAKIKKGAKKAAK